MGPEADYERTGNIGRCHLPCGYTPGPDNDTLNLHYGAANTSIALADGSVSEMLDWLNFNATQGDVDSG